MYLSRKLPAKIEVINIELVGGNISIRTHSAAELIMDARKIRYAGLIPQIEITNNKASIHKQAITSFFPMQENAIIKILVPENKIVKCRLFSGAINMNGSYQSVNIKLRTGNILIDGPYFYIKNNSDLNVITGGIELKSIVEDNASFKRTAENKCDIKIGNSNLHSMVFFGAVSVTGG